MGINDLIITPFYVLLILFAARMLRPLFTDPVNRAYFMPALLVKIAGAIAVGLIYQFYYNGGDTFNFHTHGSVHIWQALVEYPSRGLAMLADNGTDQYNFFEYSSRIWYYGDKASYAVVKLAAVFDLFTYATYSATAVLFATLSFSGLWALFLTFYRMYPSMHRWIAAAVLFVPSVFFWGSGIFKDTVVLTAFGWTIYAFYRGILKWEKPYIFIPVMLAAMYVIYVIKIYILLILLPAFILWMVLANLYKVRVLMLRILILPFLLSVAGLFSFLAIQEVSEDSRRYSIDNLAETVRVTAYDIRYGWGARFGEGSGYTLGELDGTFGSMIRLAPAAINVSLFRPWLFEVQNPLMLLSALESFLILCITVFVLFRLISRRRYGALLRPEVVFCLTFSLVFAFAVGVSTFNFGTLSRYRLPLIPLYLLAMTILYYYTSSNREKNVSRAEFRE